MTEHTFQVIEFLKDWQTISYDTIDSADDVKVFNVIGTIIQLTSNNYMSIADSFHFVSDNLSLEQEVKERIATVLTNAYDSANTLH